MPNSRSISPALLSPRFNNSRASNLNSFAYFRYTFAFIPFLLMVLVYSIRTFFVSIISGEAQMYLIIAYIVNFDLAGFTPRSAVNHHRWKPGESPGSRL